MNTDKALGGIAVLVLIICVVGMIAFLIIGIVKHLLWYNANCKFRYAQYQRLLKDLDELEDDINRHQFYDWSKAPEEPTAATRDARPGSDAHYAAWRAEQLKKKESRE